MNRNAETRAPLPVDEERRLAALRRDENPDPEPESEFDDIALRASRICETPIALISFVDKNRPWFKSRFGKTVSQTPRDTSFCAHRIRHRDRFGVKDALADERFAAAGPELALYRLLLNQPPKLDH